MAPAPISGTPPGARTKTALLQRQRLARTFLMAAAASAASSPMSFSRRWLRAPWARCSQWSSAWRAISAIWWLTSDNPDQRKYHRKLCRGNECLIVGRVVRKESDRI
ncbi:hypothetical protein [Janthinobacterium sp. HLX7-2]|uniref:hypothetical protein n=1 Tax=Janthinobacterium sp. HLX7-2 TaxID=1259331 RepID=UPI003F21F535